MCNCVVKNNIVRKTLKCGKLIWFKELVAVIRKNTIRISERRNMKWINFAEESECLIKFTVVSKIYN